VSASGARCEFSFLLNERAPFPTGLVRLGLSAGAVSYTVMLSLNIGVGGDAFSDLGPNADAVAGQSLSHAFSGGVWHHVAMEASFGAAGHAKAEVDGATYTFTDSATALTAVAGATQVSLQVGVSGASGTGTWSVLYANFYCDLIP
jgi:hypothetical protein